MQSCQCPVILPSDLINETKSKYGGDPAHNGAHIPSTLSKSEKSFFQLQRLLDFDPPSLMNDGELDGRSMAEEKEKRILFVLQLPPIPAHFVFVFVFVFAHSYFGPRSLLAHTLALVE